MYELNIKDLIKMNEHNLRELVEKHMREVLYNMPGELPNTTLNQAEIDEIILKDLDDEVRQVQSSILIEDYCKNCGNPDSSVEMFNKKDGERVVGIVCTKCKNLISEMDEED